MERSAGLKVGHILFSMLYFVVTFFFSNRVIYTEEDGDSDEDSWRFMASARRGSIGLSIINRPQQPLNDARDRIALDISLLKKQYAKLRERQKQAHIILSNAARQTVNPGLNSSQLSVNQYLAGRNAIISNKGKRIGPPAGSIPPARQAAAATTTAPPSVKQTKYTTKQARRGRDKTAEIDKTVTKTMIDSSNIETRTGGSLQKSHSTASSTSSISSGSDVPSTSIVPKRRLRKESSSYSEDDSDHELVDDKFDDGSSSTSTSLCDDDPNIPSSIEASPLKKRAPSSASNYGTLSDDNSCSSPTIVPNSRRNDSIEQQKECAQPALAPDYVINSPKAKSVNNKLLMDEILSDSPKSDNTIDIEITPSSILTTSDSNELGQIDNAPTIAVSASPSSANLNTYEKELLFEALNLPAQITSTSQLSPIADIAEYLSYSCISPLKSPVSLLYLDFDSTGANIEYSAENTTNDEPEELFKVKEDGVTNEYFEHVNQVTTDYSVKSLDESLPDTNKPSNVFCNETIEPKTYLTLNSNQTKDKIVINIDSQKTAELPTELNLEAINKLENIDWKANILQTPIDFVSNYDVTSSPMETDKQLELKFTNTGEIESANNIPEDSLVTTGVIQPDIPSYDYTTSTGYEQSSNLAFELNLDNPDPNKNTDKVLKIIAENSKILHRIMNKNITNDDLVKENQMDESSSTTELSAVDKFLLREEKKSLSSEIIDSDDVKLKLTNEFISPSKEWSDFTMTNANNDASGILISADTYSPTFYSYSTDHNLYKEATAATGTVKTSLGTLETGELDINVTKWDDGNDSPTQSIDHIVNSDSDYTVRNVSACSDILDNDKEDTVREIDEYLYGIVKSPSGHAQTTVKDDVPSDDLVQCVELRTKTDDDTYVRAKESRFSKYIDDVAAGLIPDQECSVVDRIDSNVDITGSADTYSPISKSNTMEHSYSFGNLVNKNQEYELTVKPKGDLSEIDLKPDKSTIENNVSPLTNTSAIRQINTDTNLLPYDNQSFSSASETVELEKHQAAAQSIKPIPMDSDQLINNSGDISATISSIKNTIKSIDSLCKEDHQSRSRSRTDKTLEKIIKVVEQMDANKVKELSKESSKERSRPVSLVINDTFSHETISMPLVESSERRDRYLSLPRCSRDRWRDLSPRRRNKEDADFAEYESRARRDKSPLNENTIIESNYADDSTDKSTHQTYSSFKSYDTTDKFEIRHTTVTSTFYDRYLSQKRERKIRIDKSPSSPVITRAYLNTLKPDHRDSDCDRNSKSAENSPNRLDNLFQYDSDFKTKPLATTSYLLHPQYPAISSTRFTNYTKSCDNIPSRLNTYHRTSNNPNIPSATTSNTDIPSAVSTISTTISKLDSLINDSNRSLNTNKKTSVTNIGFTYTPIPVKTKSPTELGIQLGMYKSTSP